VLRGLVEQERLFRTAHARGRWEAAARRNVADELGELEGEDG
jgi:predicted metal-dependent HD superfamily phosphohydrolase